MFKIYLPVISKSCGKFGLATSNPIEEDIKNLGVSWWYNWSDTGNIPMLWKGNISQNIPKDYSGYILVFNEPNNSFQSNLPVDDAVKRYISVREYYHKAKLVVGGTSIFAFEWLRNFVNETVNNPPDFYHIHVYIESWIDLNQIKIWMTEHEKFLNRNLWVTETNAVYPHTDEEFEGLIIYLDSLSYVDKIAVYTNRQNKEDKINYLEGCSLVNDDGSLTKRGKWFSNFVKTK